MVSKYSERNLLRKYAERIPIMLRKVDHVTAIQ